MKSADNGAVTLEEAAQVIADQEQADSADCLKEIEAILQKYNRRFDVAILITAQGNMPQLNLVKR